jgi:hypothetical protein
MARVRLRDFCQARSGDKGNTVNAALFAPSEELYAVLREQVTSESVARLVGHLVAGLITRYEVPNVRALNFVCTRALGGGGARSLRADNLGKTFASNLLHLEVDVPDNLVATFPDLVAPIKLVSGRVIS